MLCVNHEAGNVALDTRCRAVSDVMAQAGGTTTMRDVDGANAAEAQRDLEAALASNPDIDAVLALGTGGSGPATAALKAADRLDDVLFATFDLGPDVLCAVRDGEVLFAIDQQPYMQGYLAVTLMVKYLETQAIPGGGQVIRTGPAFVTQENADSVIRLSEQRRR